MGRTHRSYLPGAVFHLTTRTQGREPWFTSSVRTRVEAALDSVVGQSDVRLLAYAVMPNHFHLVVRQGKKPLGHLMQPLLRKVALVVQRAHGVGGHVFERRFRDRPCLDLQHVRNAIVYTHLNPLRAGLVDDPDRYRWSSQGQYSGHEGNRGRARPPAEIESSLWLFAPWEGASQTELRSAYVRYIGWQIQHDRYDAARKAGLPVDPPPLPPHIISGESRSPRFPLREIGDGSPVSPADSYPPMPVHSDLGQIARAVLLERAPDLPLDVVRSGGKTKLAVAVRRAMVLRMAIAGHPGGAIARYLRVTPQCVSNTVCQDRQLRTDRHAKPTS